MCFTINCDTLSSGINVSIFARLYVMVSHLEKNLEYKNCGVRKEPSFLEYIS